MTKTVTSNKSCGVLSDSSIPEEIAAIEQSSIASQKRVISLKNTKNSFSVKKQPKHIQFDQTEPKLITNQSRSSSALVLIAANSSGALLSELGEEHHEQIHMHQLQSIFKEDSSDDNYPKINLSTNSKKKVSKRVGNVTSLKMKRTLPTFEKDMGGTTSSLKKVQIEMKRAIISEIPESQSAQRFMRGQVISNSQNMSQTGGFG